MRFLKHFDRHRQATESIQFTIGILEQGRLAGREFAGPSHGPHGGDRKHKTHTLGGRRGGAKGEWKDVRLAEDPALP